MNAIRNSLVLGRAIVFAALCLALNFVCAGAQNATHSGPPASGSKVMGELKFDGASKIEKEFRHQVPPLRPHRCETVGMIFRTHRKSNG